ncbi:twin-arginine translocase TatA/TatE family subunit [Photobacterium kishitanii]|uniref:Sec-independent protein translocase protein TatA n=1 Tax=Photobacterium kishitanii TaxID=318456 RepID=A0A2T3QRK9_9GAMM|nr:twin-arginine translocase TatA/TatE family subunit [Photobacterium kishitanii]OBU23920.1 preprotein translocase subunit TatA [Photobacterium kishitanii]PSU19998.1 twin-arginine translocase TatA/TatE family subunit [Photobacterium kishitanii]PSU89620.1 twin-arginine translocase TatA/TatE family subunit [Photobacterium kishitanii]PSU93439.1 twin-arginine translocase TatA/TatE family subunit [Photobacterium kishitanii]PSV11180.1 twin-arginine translocase TatA/TatE family subunit [Photobacteriu
MGEISIGKLLIVAVIFVLLFGTKKLRTLGSDLGCALRGFQNAIKDEPQSKTETVVDTQVATKSADNQ